MKHRRRRASEAEWAWAAGLFEGEGSIVLNSRWARLQLKMTDEDVVRRLASIVGGHVYGPHHYDYADGFVRKPTWTWTSDGQDIAFILRGFRPWLGVRRRARIDALGLLEQGTLW